ncbi:MAG TPA: oligopeptide/dipeptide ABC transporter ATP-binding protein [Acidimicrobiia bacterium]|nr:oligopeptide/dipeptide ABC transporter ATP-binding protein [Acidimicrobiia bacterium]
MRADGHSHLRPDADLLLEVRDLVVEFPADAGETVHAVSGVTFDLARGETLGLVGESGCGKSTTGHAIMQLVHAKSGNILLRGKDLNAAKGEDLRSMRPQFQMIFQDPLASLNPRRRIRDVVAEPLTIWPERFDGHDGDLVADMLEAVGLDVDLMGDKKPRAFSGGQAQRIAIARALILEPALLVCDEPVASLDVSVQGQILNLLASMKKRYGLTMLFIAHDLAVIKNVSDRLAVMYLGKLCEIGDSDQVYERPTHHYTRALLDAVPRLDDDRPAAPPLGGEVPSPINPPSGCRFRTRCPAATQVCVNEEPVMRIVAHDHYVACHHPIEYEAPIAEPQVAVAG